MELLKNSVFITTGVDGVVDGTYRIVDILPAKDLIFLFELVSPEKLKKPVSLSLSYFVKCNQLEKLKSSGIDIPEYMLRSDEEIPSKYIDKRDSKYQVVADFLACPENIVDLAENVKSRVIKIHAKKHGVVPQYVRRSLNLYWYYGMGENSLLLAYAKSGGRDREKTSGVKKRGRPVFSINDYFTFQKGVNVDEGKREKIKKGAKKFYLTKKGVTLRKAYENTLKEFFKEELEGEMSDGEVRVPSYFQYCYWVKKIFSEHERVVRRTSVSDYNKNKRELLSVATSQAPLPGSCFELDATVADVNVVSAFNRDHVLGRPTLYFVVDKCSRMIVGFHVSLKFSSWEAGRQALVNSFLPKKQLCARYGIAIEEEEWPCAHLPERLLCDRGEFICSQPEKLVVPMMQLNIAPPYRADAKGIVERRFGIFNENLFHDLSGGVKKAVQVRGEVNPRDHAIFTLDEIGALLIHEIMSHNRKKLESLAVESEIFIQNGIDPTPINYWNYAISNCLNALSVLPEQDVVARLLPAKEVTLCSHGIRYGSNLYYQSGSEEFRRKVANARQNGVSKLEARVDKDCMDFIYVRLVKGASFTKVFLTKKSKIFASKHEEDVEFYASWKQSVFRGHGLDSRDIDAYEEKEEISRLAVAEVDSSPGLVNKSERYRNMRERRKEEASQEIMPHDHATDGKKLKVAPADDRLGAYGKEDISNVVSLLKRKKSK
ncbi:hypothetical protein [Onishia taeanensis]